MANTVTTCLVIYSPLLAIISHNGRDNDVDFMKHKIHTHCLQPAYNWSGYGLCGRPFLASAVVPSKLSENMHNIDKT